jgi:transcriptional regulator GlxA family with amidase domain
MELLIQSLLLISLLSILVILLLIYVKNAAILERYLGLYLLSITPQAQPKENEQNNKAKSSGRYERSHLSNVDINKLEADLRQAMEIDRVYRDSTISLKLLAEHIDVTLHQLSEYLNKYHNKNFNTYVSEFRVKDAKELLLKYDWRTTLSIAFEVGFNSNSSFNRCFKLITGTSPGQFRKDAGK